MADIAVTLKKNGTVTCKKSTLQLAEQPERITWRRASTSLHFNFTGLIGLPARRFGTPVIGGTTITVDYLGGLQPGDWGYTVTVVPTSKRRSERQVINDGSGTIRNHS